ncbi:MAG: tetratricopeptide repeat protein [Gemmatimonadaceae bacterium]
MPDVAKLKKKAAEFELKKQFDKALAVYVEILDGYDKASDEEVDVSLFNRVGDLYLKQGSVGDAVDYYEQAVDRYAEGGFHNNAIALCNKILRNSPGRASVYYKLGKISAQKGFKSDAKKNFLEYADRMQSSGKIDEAFRALKEFADLCPDQDDIRLMLAEQLSKNGRSDEAIEQLQLLYVRYSHEGRDAEARATIERMKAIDPSSEPRALGDAPSRSAADLVFLDLNDSAPPRRGIQSNNPAMRGLELLATGEEPIIPSPPVVAAPPTPPAPPHPSALVSASPAPTEELLDTPFLEPAVLDGVTRSAEHDRVADIGGSLLEGLESTSFISPVESEAPRELLDFEPTSFTPPTPTSAARPAIDSSTELLDFDLGATPGAGSTRIPSAADVPLMDFGEIELPPVEFDEPEEESHDHRGSLLGLPLIADDDGDEPTADATPVDDDSTIGGDLQLIMPDGTPARGARAQPTPTDDLPLIDVDGTPIGGVPLVEEMVEPVVDEEVHIPLMDISLPTPGEAMASIMDAGRNSVEMDIVNGVEMNAFDTVEPEAFDHVEMDSFDAVEAEALELEPAIADAADLAGEEESATSEDDDLDDIQGAPIPHRQSTVIAKQDVDLLLALSEADPDDNLLRRRLAEAMLESGDREGGLQELETAMVGFERHDDLAAASKIADEIVLLNPSSVRHHQKRVEYAFRTNERGRLIEAYLQLADALFRAGQAEKSRAIYQRVIDLSPDDLRAQSALESFPAPEPEPAPPPAPPKGRATVSGHGVAAPVPAAPKLSPTPDYEFINLGDWLRDDEVKKDTRMIVDEQEPTGDEEADFQDMLQKFKQGIAENVEEEDHQSHYDLGVAFKEMGLLDEAIAEFQKALRAPANRVPTYEALGQCFIEKEQYPMAATILGRALHEPHMSENQLVGVLYLLGRCAQQRGQRDAAIEYYQRVFVVDIQFQDVGERLAAVEGAPS